MYDLDTSIEAAARVHAIAARAMFDAQEALTIAITEAKAFHVTLHAAHSGDGDPHAAHDATLAADKRVTVLSNVHAAGVVAHDAATANVSKTIAASSRRTGRRLRPATIAACATLESAVPQAVAADPIPREDSEAGDRIIVSALVCHHVVLPRSQDSSRAVVPGRHAWACLPPGSKPVLLPSMRNRSLPT
jgi:hypothetical protein